MGHLAMPTKIHACKSSICIIYHTLPFTVLSLKNCHPRCPENVSLAAIRKGMNKMAAGDEYLEFIGESLERMEKRWSTFVRGFLDEMLEFKLTSGWSLLL